MKQNGHRHDEDNTSKQQFSFFIKNRVCPLKKWVPVMSIYYLYNTLKLSLIITYNFPFHNDCFYSLIANIFHRA